MKSKTKKTSKTRAVKRIKIRNRKAILVLGMHRSGTSAVTRVLNLLGAKLPVNLMPPVPNNNEMGFWESNDLMVIHNNILKSANMSWDEIGSCPENWWGSSAAMEFRNILLEKSYSCY